MVDAGREEDVMRLMTYRLDTNQQVHSLKASII